MKALLTGFKPRPGKLSPSMMAVDWLRGARIGGLEVVGAELPEDFSVISAQTERLIETERPRVAISIAWDNPPWVKLERIAINVMSSRVGDRMIPDHEGHTPEEQAVVEGGPLAYASTLPTDRIESAMSKAGIKAHQSYEVGTHVRNAVMYSLLHWSTLLGTMTIAGQIHVPPVPGMFGPEQRTMDPEDEARAVKIALEVCADSLTNP